MAFTYWLGAAIGVYIVAMYALAWYCQGKIENETDFLAAGRRMPLSLAWLTLLATWFGAGTLLTASTEVHETGLSAALLDPIGAGVCLLLVGAFYARRLRRLEILTVSDFFRLRFGVVSEKLSALVLAPSYLGWIAAQFVALAELLHHFGLAPRAWGMIAVAIVGTGYTLLGGMWSVAVTDAAQIAVVILGVVVLAGAALWRLGDGDLFAAGQVLLDETSAEKLALIDDGSSKAVLAALAVLAVGALGNVPGQDLMQRVFSSKDEKTASRACFIAGGAYLVFGAAPVVLGLAAAVILPAGFAGSVVPALAEELLHPAAVMIFVLAVISAVLSTIDSALLAPAGIVAQNLLVPVFGKRWSHVKLNQACVLGAAGLSLAIAFAGEGAYELLEASYATIFVTLFAPLTWGLYSEPRRDMRRRDLACAAGIVAGLSSWGIHYAFQWDHWAQPILATSLPADLGSAAFATSVMAIAAFAVRRRGV